MLVWLKRWLPWIVAIYKYGKEQKWWGLNVHLEEAVKQEIERHTDDDTAQ